MAIMIGENYKLSSNRLNLILLGKSDSKDNSEEEADGEKVENGWRLVGYYGSLRSVIKRLVNLDIKRTDYESLEVVADKIDSLYTLVDKVCPGITVSDLREEKRGKVKEDDNN